MITFNLWLVVGIGVLLVVVTCVFTYKLFKKVQKIKQLSKIDITDYKVASTIYLSELIEHYSAEELKKGLLSYIKSKGLRSIEYGFIRNVYIFMVQEKQI